MSSNNVGHLIASTITTLQHLATLRHTSPDYTSLHLSTLHFLSFTLHYPLIWLISYRPISPHITKQDTAQLSHPQTYFQNNEPLHCPKDPLTISLHFFFFSFFLFFHLSYHYEALVD
jgi:quinol-cytochrome oxidoreductase complex cytochrome b subunit